MGITGLIPFIEKASRRANVGEFSGCTVAIDSYCWLHKGAFACAEKLVRGEETDIYVKYCIKYVTMLLSRNIKPILVFDGRHLPAKAMTESKRRESRDISKKRAAELLSLGKTDEARSYMRRSVDITHSMALALIKECRKRNVDCIVAPYEADAQLAYLNIKNIAHLVITEDSDLILFGCTKVLFKMDLEGNGTLVETPKLPLVMKCPIEHYTFDKFRRMCIMSGCDYLASLPGIGLAKARQFVNTTQDPDFANALRKLPSFFNKMALTMTDEYRESFLKAEATFKHQYVYDPLERKMVRLTEPDDEDVEQALCVNAGELLDANTAFQLALGNLDPFTLRKMDEWHPDDRGNKNEPVRTDSWRDKGVSSHPSIWHDEFRPHVSEACPWQKKPRKTEPIIAVPRTRPRKKVVNLVAKFVPETQDQDESLSIQSLSNMYCVEPAIKKQKTDCDREYSETFTQYSEEPHNLPIRDTEISQKERSPILENKERSFKKCLKTASYSVLKRLSRFPRTILDDKVVESKFFSNNQDSINESKDGILQDNLSNGTVKLGNANISIEHNIDKGVNDAEDTSPKRNPFKVTQNIVDKSVIDDNATVSSTDRYGNTSKAELPTNMNLKKKEMIKSNDDALESSQKENSPGNSPRKVPSPILAPSPKVKMPVGLGDRPTFDQMCSEESVIENTYPMETLVTPVDSQSSYGASSPEKRLWSSQPPVLSSFQRKVDAKRNGIKSSPSKNARLGLKRTTSLPSNQPTLLTMFGFQKKPVLKR